MEGPISFWGYKEQESNLIHPEHDDDDDDNDDDVDDDDDDDDDAIFSNVRSTSKWGRRDVGTHLHKVYVIFEGFFLTKTVTGQKVLIEVAWEKKVISSQTD